MRHLLPVLPFVVSSCTIVAVDSDLDPPRVESEGLINSHLAVGVPQNDDLLKVDLFDGTSPSALAEVEIWKLLRVEVGLAGASVGVGPFELGIGVLGYDPALTRTSGSKENREVPPATTEAGPDVEGGQTAETAEEPFDESGLEWEPEHDR